jgi:hypothetical protein
MQWIKKFFKNKSRVPIIKMGDSVGIDLSGRIVYVRLSQVEMDLNGPTTAVLTQPYPKDIYYV